jgi:pseudaminic acid cytidylyltransferase
MKTVAIIPARSGSKRIPLKNIKEFLGKPIITYSINAALRSKLFDKVFVLTDCNDIAQLSELNGASIPYIRSKKSSNDFAVLNDVISEFYENSSEHYDYGCLILATAPLIDEKNLANSFDILRTEGFDSIRPVVEFDYPIQKAFKMQERGLLKFYFDKVSLSSHNRSQDFEKTYHDAGQFYWFKYGGYLNTGNRGGYPISKMEAQDIDDIEDWKIAELKYSFLKGQHR